MGKGELGGTGWEKPGALTLQPEDFELLGLEASLGPATGGPTDTSSPRGGWTLRARMEQGRSLAAGRHLLRILTPKQGGRQGGIWARCWAVREGSAGPEPGTQRTSMCTASIAAPVQDAVERNAPERCAQ